MKKTYQLIGGPHDGLDLETEGERELLVDGLLGDLLASVKVATKGIALVPDGRTSRYRLRRDPWGHEAYIFAGYE